MGVRLVGVGRMDVSVLIGIGTSDIDSEEVVVVDDFVFVVA